MLIIPDRPPMGWNSWNAYMGSPDEEEMKAQMRYMASKLLPHGYKYFTTDAMWYRAGDSGSYRYSVDEYGRNIPHPEKYPCSKDGSGFRKLADYAHSLGLEFGLHMMRGINTWQLGKGACVKGTAVPLEEIINYDSPCDWGSKGWYGVKTEMPESQIWYDSLFEQWAQWGVDFVKYDDIAQPLPENEKEIVMVNRALAKCGRDMVLSLSPGGKTKVSDGEFYSKHASMWRISGDFWDSWGNSLKRSFDLLETWNSRIEYPGWPDADMIPIGWLTELPCDRGLFPRKCRFTEDEMRALFTLFSISRSPLILTCNLLRNDADLLYIQTQPDCIAVNQRGEKPHFDRIDESTRIWHSRADGNDYIAVFNLADSDKYIEVSAEGTALDVWTDRMYVPENGKITAAVAAHGAALLRTKANGQ